MCLWCRVVHVIGHGRRCRHTGQPQRSGFEVLSAPPPQLGRVALMVCLAKRPVHILPRYGNVVVAWVDCGARIVVRSLFAASSACGPIFVAMATPHYLPVVVQSNGVPTASTWKAWRWADGSLQWDAWDVLPHLAPARDWHLPNVRLTKILRRDFKGFWDWLDALQIPKEAVLSLSAKAARASGAELDDMTHSTTAMTTFCVLALCGWASGARGTQKNRLAAGGCLSGIILCICPGFQNSRLDFGELADDVSDLCDQGGVGEDVCQHLALVLAQAQGDDILDNLRCMLSVGFGMEGGCQAVSEFLANVCEIVTIALHDGFETRGFPTNPLTNAVLKVGCKRRRVVDEDYKSALVRAGCRGQGSLGAAAAVIGLDENPHTSRGWDVSRLPAHMAANWKYWPHAEVVSIAADASRLGQPGEDTMVYAITDGVRSSWLPPQVATGRGVYCVLIS